MNSAAELQQAIDDAHELFFRSFDGFDDTTLEMQSVSGVWSARDVAGHLADWHNEMIDTLERVRKNEPQRRPIADIDSWNHDQAALRGIETWPQSSDDLRVAWTRVNEMLATIAESEFDRVAPLPWGTVDRVGGFFRRIARHTRAHAEEAQVWRMWMLGVRERNE